MPAGRFFSGQCSHIKARVCKQQLWRFKRAAVLPDCLARSHQGGTLAVRQTYANASACLHEEEHHLARDVAADAVHIHVALASHPASCREESTHTPFTLSIGAPPFYT